MPTRASLPLLLVGLVLASPPAHAAPRAVKHHLVLPQKPVAPGQRLVLEVKPPVPGLAIGGDSKRKGSAAPAPQFRYAWRIASGPGSITLDGIFSAPYIVTPGNESARIELLVKNDAGKLDTLVRDDLRLAPGVFPGADSCLGPGQSFDESAFELTEIDELPEPLTRVAADYPASARARKAAGNFVVRAIVCRTGRVLDGHVVWPVGAVQDLALERAAIDAALQWTFAPGISGRNPVATVVDIPFVFKP